MENASKALIIAGAILLGILIVGLGMYIYQQAAGIMDEVSFDKEQIGAYNSAFLRYEGKQTGSAVRILCDEVRSHNSAYQDDSTLQISIHYGEVGGLGSGTAKQESTIGTAVTVANVTAVKNAIKTGKTYTVALTTAVSGRIMDITITDYTAGE